MRVLPPEKKARRAPVAHRFSPEPDALDKKRAEIRAYIRAYPFHSVRRLLLAIGGRRTTVYRIVREERAALLAEERELDFTSLAQGDDE